MHLSVVHHKPYKLKMPQFVCDFVLKESPKPFDRLTAGFRFIVLTGRPGSGKTSLLISCLLDSKILKKTFNNVICVMPESSRQSLKRDPFKDLDPSKLFGDLEDIDKIFKMVEYNAGQNESSLIIIDDMQSYLKMPAVSTVLNHIIANRRHLRTSVIVLMQTYNLIPLKTRKLINCLVTFRPVKKEFQSICEELLDTSDQKIQEEIYKYAFRDKGEHAWLLIDVSSGRLFSEFDEISYDGSNIEDATEKKEGSSKKT